MNEQFVVEGNVSDHSPIGDTITNDGAFHFGLNRDVHV